MAADEQPEEQFWALPSDELSAEAIGYIFKAALTSPPGTLTYEPEGDQYTDCPACRTPWEDCEASQLYADEEDEACCDGCEHEWVPPPPTYTIVQFGEPEKPPVPHLEGGPWSAVEALRGPFFPLGRKP